MRKKIFYSALSFVAFGLAIVANIAAAHCNIESREARYILLLLICGWFGYGFTLSLRLIWE